MKSEKQPEQPRLNHEVLYEERGAWKEYRKVQPQGHIRIRLKKGRPEQK